MSTIRNVEGGLHKKCLCRFCQWNIDESVSNLGSMSGVDIGDFLDKMFMTVATGVVLKSLFFKIKINKLAVYSLQPDAGTVTQTVHSVHRYTASLRVKTKRREEYTSRG